MFFSFFISSFTTASTIITGAYTVFICVELSIAMTIMVTRLALGHYSLPDGKQLFNQSQSFLKGQHIVFQAHCIIFLIIFLFLNFVEEVIGIFRSPFTSVFYIPLRSLHFPVRYIVSNCK